MADRTLVIATGHALSLALGEGGGVLARHHERIGLGHAEALMPALARMLEPFGGARAGVARILVEVGPGSFTGLRIGLAAASALALAWGVALAGIRSTLMVAAAHGAYARGDRLGVALRAPRGQYWVEAFAMPSLDSCSPPLALAAEALADWARSLAMVGLPESDTVNVVPDAAAAIGLSPSLFSPVQPLYVRQQDDARLF